MGEKVVHKPPMYESRVSSYTWKHCLVVLKGRFYSEHTQLQILAGYLGQVNVKSTGFSFIIYEMGIQPISFCCCEK